MSIRKPQEFKFNILLESNDSPDAYRARLEKVFGEVQIKEIDSANADNDNLIKWMGYCCDFYNSSDHKIYSLSVISSRTRGAMIDLLGDLDTKGLMNDLDDYTKMGNRIDYSDNSKEMYIELFRGFLEDYGTKIPSYQAAAQKRFKIQSNWITGIQTWFELMLEQNLINDSALKEKMKNWGGKRKVKNESEIHEVDELLKGLLYYLKQESLFPN